MNKLLALWGAVAGPAPPPPSPPNIDAYQTGLYGAYSLSRLLSAYAGHAMTVRRSSDNATANIDYITGGGLDTVTLLAFCGSGDGFINTLFDQSGHGNHLAQTADTTKQPKIVSAGSYLGAIIFDGSNDCLQSVNNNSGGSAASMYLGGTLNSTSSVQYFFESDNGVGGSSSLLGSTGWRYNSGTAAYEAALVTASAANVILGAKVGISLSNSTQTVVTDYTQSTPATRVVYYDNAVQQTLSISISGTVSTSATIEQFPWNIGARNDGASFPAHLSLKNALIYSVAHASSDVSGVTTVLNHYL